MAVSAEIVAIDSPTEIDTDRAADAAENESCNESNSRSNPPADPADDYHAEYNAEFVHDSALVSDKLRLKRSLQSHSPARSARLPQRDDFRNFLMSEECAGMAQLVANLA